MKKSRRKENRKIKKQIAALFLRVNGLRVALDDDKRLVERRLQFVECRLEELVE